MSMSKGGFRPNSGRKKGSIPWNKGIAMSEESKKKVSLSKKGTPAWNKGIPMSIEAKAKLSAVRKGKSIWPNGRVFSKEWRENMSLARKGKESPNKGKKMSGEQKEKLRTAHTGKEHSLEHREANRQGQYRRWLKLNPNYVLMGRNKKIAHNGGFHSRKDWESLKERYNWACANPECRKKEPGIKLTRDHILPLLMGGKNDITNIQPLCLKCNKSKFTRTIKY